MRFIIVVSPTNWFAEPKAVGLTYRDLVSDLRSLANSIEAEFIMTARVYATGELVPPDGEAAPEEPVSPEAASNDAAS